MIFVTGSTGLVGSHLICQLAKKGKKIKALVRNSEKIRIVQKVFSYYSDQPDELLKNVEWIEGDILNPASYFDALSGVNTVYHCAAMVSFDKKDKEQLLMTNIEGTANVVNVSLENKVKKLCSVSSVAALGGSKNGEIITEDNVWNSSANHSFYAISKFKSEMEVWRGIQEGLDAVIVNPSVILGPGFWNSGSGLIFTRAAKGMSFYTCGSTGFVDVRDVVDLMQRLTESEVVNQRFIITGESVVYKDLFNMISDALGRKRPNIEASRTMLQAARIVDGWLSGLRIKNREITQEVIHSSLSKTDYSNQKIKQLFPVEFIPVKKTILEMAALYKRELTSNE